MRSRPDDHERCPGAPQTQMLPEQRRPDAGRDHRLGDRVHGQRHRRQTDLVGALHHEQCDDAAADDRVRLPADERRGETLADPVGERLGQHGHQGFRSAGRGTEQGGPLRALPREAGRQEDADTTGRGEDEDQPVRLRGHCFAVAGRPGKGEEERQPAQRGHHRHPLAPPERLTGQRGGDRQGEHEVDGDQGLDDDQRARGQCPGLHQPAAEVREQADQPPRS